MLPSILEVAQQHGLQMNVRSSQSAKEIRFKCPFCGADAHKKDKFYLSLNLNKNLFKCWSCGEGGGVLTFIALLDDKSIEEVKNELWGSNQSPRELHPAETLKPQQIRAMGFIGYYGKEKYKNPDYYKRTLDWIWKEWQMYSMRLKRLAYIGIVEATTTEEIHDSCKAYAEQLGVSTADLLLELTQLKFSHNKPEWAKSAEWFVAEAKKSEQKISPDQRKAG
jgi:hypothetical protein